MHYHKKLNKGPRYLRDGFPNLSNTRISLSRFLSLEKKCENNPEFRKKYQKTIKEYIEKRDTQQKLKMKITQTL